MLDKCLRLYQGGWVTPRPKEGLRNGSSYTNQRLAGKKEEGNNSLEMPHPAYNVYLSAYQIPDPSRILEQRQDMNSSGTGNDYTRCLVLDRLKASSIQ